MSRVELPLPLHWIGRERRFRLLDRRRLLERNGLGGRVLGSGFDLNWRRRRWRMGLDRRTLLCRLSDLGRWVEYRRLSIVRVLIILLGVLAIRRCLRLAWGAGR